MTNISNIISKEFKELENKIKYDDFTLYCYESDMGKAIRGSPIAVVFPENRDDVSSILKLSNEYNIPVTVKGGGTTIGGETVAKNSIIIDTKKMNKIFKIDKKENIIEIDSGHTWLEIYEILRKYNLTFKVAPSSGSCTV